MSLLLHQTRLNFSCAFPCLSSLIFYPQNPLFLFPTAFSPHQTSNGHLLQVLSRRRGRQDPSQRSLTPGKPVYLFADVKKNAVAAGTATLSNGGTLGKNSPGRSLHSYEVPCSDGLDSAAIRSPATYQHFKYLYYAHYFITADIVPETLNDFSTSCFYA